MAAKFEVFRGTNSQYYFRLKAPNGETILSSEGYVSKASCLGGVQSAKANAPFDGNYKRLMSRNAQYYFTLNAANGQVVGTGETYTTASARDDGIAAVKRYAPDAPIVDLT